MPSKLGIDECSFCKKPCIEQIYKVEHRWKDRKPTTITFCSYGCLVDFVQVKERVQDQVHALLEKEKKELYKRVCPACAWRFDQLA